MRPLLRWVGSKEWLVEKVRPFYRSNQRIVEPFAGGAAISFALEPRVAQLSDLNPDLINFYRWVQRAPDRLPQQVELNPDPGLYYQHRAEFNAMRGEERDTLHAAALFFYLHRFGFNHVWRVNASGTYNVPLRAGKKPEAWPNLLPYAELMRDWILLNRDYEDVAILERDLVYLDPPYLGTFDGYTHGRFGAIAHARLAKWAAAPRTGPTLVSNHPAAGKLYLDRGFVVSMISGRQRMLAKAGRDTMAGELFAYRQGA